MPTPGGSLGLARLPLRRRAANALTRRPEWRLLWGAALAIAISDPNFNFPGPVALLSGAAPWRTGG